MTRENTTTMVFSSVRIVVLQLALQQLATATSALSSIAQPRVALPNVDASAFRHPLDRDLTSLIQKAPLSGLGEEVIRRSFPIIEQGVRLDLLSSSVKVSENQLPDLYELLVEACDIMDLKVTPDLYIQSSPQANAYTLALQGRRNNSAPIVVVTSTLLERCSNPEVQAIIGHELGHLKCEHSLYLTLGGIAATPWRGLLDSVVERWRLAAEYSCDRAALLVAQDSQVVAGAMLKLFAGTARATSTEAFVAQCLEYDELLKSANPLVRASINRQQRTHPLPVRRVAELEQWAKSEQYLQILKRGTELGGSKAKDADADADDADAV